MEQERTYEHHMAIEAQEFDRIVDVAVVGAGAGGMVAAWVAKTEGLDVLLTEKASQYGGNSAISGGGAWIPNAPEFLRRGERDDPEDVVAYLQAIAPDVDVRRHRRYVDEAPKLAAALEDRGWFKDGFLWARGYSDYHPEKGGHPLGRGLWAAPIDGRLLGDDLAHLRGGRKRMAGAPKGMWLTSLDFHALTALRWKGLRGKRMLFRLAGRTVKARVRGEQMLTSGAALIARLRLMLRDAGVDLWLEAPMRGLLTDDDGAVIGMVVVRDGREFRIKARHGVILATGGFENNAAMREDHLAAVPKGWSSGSPDNEGDGIVVGEKAGAALSLMDDAWWMPAMELPGMVWPLVAERAYPEQFIVNQAGERFANEAAPYTDFVHVQLEGHASGVSHIPAYMIVDNRGWMHNLIAGHLPGKPMPKEWLSSGLVRRADTLAELAVKIGVDPQTLERTAKRYNELAERGRDEDFGRGESPYDNYYGNPDYANPNLGPVVKPPFLAFRLIPGDLGTKGGILTDDRARALRADGGVLEGLYATGNVSASIMGNDYAGPGATIGPAMTFGWVAAHEVIARAQAKPSGASPAATG